MKLISFYYVETGNVFPNPRDKNHILYIVNKRHKGPFKAGPLFNFLQQRKIYILDKATGGVSVDEIKQLE